MNQSLKRYGNLFIQLYRMPFVLSCKVTGSQIICDPPPNIDKSDFDFIIHVEERNGIRDMSKLLKELGFVYHAMEDYHINMNGMNGKQSGFMSFRRGKLNLIVTANKQFYNRFNFATTIAKKLNLQKKHDRIDLFQEILYGLD